MQRDTSGPESKDMKQSQEVEVKI